MISANHRKSGGNIDVEPPESRCRAGNEYVSVFSRNRFVFSWGPACFCTGWPIVPMPSSGAILNDRFLGGLPFRYGKPAPGFPFRPVLRERPSRVFSGMVRRRFPEPSRREDDWPDRQDHGRGSGGFPVCGCPAGFCRVMSSAEPDFLRRSSGRRVWRARREVLSG